MRYVNTVFVIWLFILVFVLPSVSIGTVWNNVIVVIVIFVSLFVLSDTEFCLIHCIV